MSELTKEKIYKKELIERGATGNNNLERIRSMSGSPELQEKTVIPTTTQQIIEADEGYDGLSSVFVEGVTSSIDNNIVAENIKKDITILGVTGTYEGSGGAGATYNIETLQATLPQNYKDYSCIQVGGNVYIFGGSLNNTNIDTIYKFNIDTETLITLQVTLPMAIYNAYTAQVGSNIYLLGGNDNNGFLNTIVKVNVSF